MASPPPPDPYAALGVAKDAEIGQIRTAHRKLVLKFHPDRIRGDDVEEKVKAKNEFQKVQQAYELLADPSKRARYDDQIKLIELQKEKMMREATRPSAFTTKSTPAPTFIRREMRSDGHFYEERAPPTSYFDSRDRFDDPVPQNSARKHEASYEKERKSSAPKSAEKREKFSAKMSSPVDGISMRMAFQMKAKASAAKERARDTHAKTQEMRDRERDRERSEKHSGRRPYAAEVHSESESDTVVPKSAPRSRRTSPKTKTEPDSPRTRAPPVRRHATSSYDEDSHEDDEIKWERHHKASMDYIAESQKRPNMTRGGSDYVFWGGDYSTGRRSGSDSEKRPSSSRRTKADDSKSRPSMPVHSSAPSNLKAYVEERGPERSKTVPYPRESREPRPTPTLGRSQTLPINKSRKDTAPVKGSNLKHSETPQTQDSGYYSSSNPHTPEMKGESPPPSRENSRKKGNSTKYQIVDPDGDDDRASRIKILDSDDDNRHRRYRSPEPDRRDRDRERERDRGDRDRDHGREDRDRPRMRERPLRTESDSRTRTNRAATTSYPRSEFRGTPPVSRPKLFGEVSSDEKDAGYSYPYDAKNVKTASYRAPTTPGYGSPRIREADDDYPGSHWRDNMRYTHSRRPSAAY